MSSRSLAVQSHGKGVKAQPQEGCEGEAGTKGQSSIHLPEGELNTDKLETSQFLVKAQPESSTTFLELIRCRLHNSR